MIICDNPRTILLYKNLNDFSCSDYEKALEKASPDRRKKTGKYLKEADRKRSAMAEMLLREALKEFGNKEVSLDYDYGINGKPYLKGENMPFFNISHSGDYVICAVSDREVGCDIQSKAEIKAGEAEKLAGRFFCKSEAAYVSAGEDEEIRRDRFCRMWTTKESFIKQSGAGLSAELSSFELVCDEKCATINKIYSDKKIVFFEPDIDPDYCCTVCVETTA